jgi:hypothetical protein
MKRVMVSALPPAPNGTRTRTMNAHRALRRFERAGGLRRAHAARQRREQRQP